MTGDSVDESDMKIKCSDSDYNDWEYSHSSNCDVSIEINMNRAKTGLLIFDIENETNNETVRNKMAVVVNGKAQCNYYASLPYKARGIDVTVVPKFFCESVAVTQNDYTIEKPYTAKKGESSYFGEEALSFSNFDDGLILYTSELKDGGYKEKRNIVNNETVFLHNGKCSFTTSDPFDKDDTVLMPKYELNIVGYITWTLLEKET